VREHEAYAPRALGWAIVTVSSTRTLDEDGTGARLAALLADAGHSRVERRVVGDDLGAIEAVVRELVALSDIDVIVLDGGTGVSPSDLTPEAVLPLLERRLDGFGELFRALSFEEIGAAAMLSRAVAGVVGTKAVFAVPGSPKGAELALRRLVLPVAPHLVGQLRRAR